MFPRALVSFALLPAALLLSAAFPSLARAETFRLLDHGDGTLGPNYGLRVDHNGPNTFSFDTTQGVTMTFDAVTGTASMSGQIQHNQGAGQLWGITASFSDPVLTHNNSDWRSNVSGALYGGAMGDLTANGDSVFGIGNLKDATVLADRIAFLAVEVTLKLISGGTPEFTLPGQENGEVTLYDFPQGDDMLPFIIAMNHRLNPKHHPPTPVGFGWLEDTPPDNQQDSGKTRDFLFRFGPQVPDPGPLPQTPEPMGVLVWLVVAAVGLLAIRRLRPTAALPV